MWNIDDINRDIQEILQSKYCWSNADKLAHLYIVRENLENDMSMEDVIGFQIESKMMNKYPRNDIGFRDYENNGGNGGQNRGYNNSEYERQRRGNYSTYNSGGESSGSMGQTRTPHGIEGISEHRRIIEKLDKSCLVDVLDRVLDKLKNIDKQCYQDAMDKLYYYERERRP